MYENIIYCITQSILITVSAFGVIVG